MKANEANLINEIRDHDMTKRKLERARDRIAELERTLARLEAAASEYLAPYASLSQRRELREAIAEALERLAGGVR